MAGLRGPPEHPAGSHGRQQTHPGDGGPADHGGRASRQAMHSKDIEKARAASNGQLRMPTGEVDASTIVGLEDGHHHGGETPQGGQDAGVHAAVPLQHALRPVLPLLAEVLLVGLQRC